MGSEFGNGLALIAWAVVFAHVVGGASLAIGFVTRVAAGVNAIVLFGAMIIAYMGAAGQGLLGANVDFQFTTFVFFSLVLLVWHGAGPLSLDRLFNGESEDRVAVS